MATNTEGLGKQKTLGIKGSTSATKTRAANGTAYGARTAVADASAPTVWTFGAAARVANEGGYIVGAMLLTNQPFCTESFRLHLYNGAAALAALADQAAVTDPLFANRAGYIGTINFPALTNEIAASGTAINVTSAYANAGPSTTSANLPMPFVTSGDANLYGILEAVNGFNPAGAQIFQVTLLTEQD